VAEPFDAVWEDLYTAGRALNKYPFDAVVSLTAKYFGATSERHRLHVLDLGSGAGNHALFFAREGFSVTCVEASAAALAVARRRFEEEGLTARFCPLRFDQIDSLEATFDLVLDRGSLVTADYDDLRTTVIPRIWAILKPGGLFISCFYSEDHPDRRLCGRSENGYTFYDLKDGSFSGASRVTLLDRRGVDELFGRFVLLQLYHHKREELFVAAGEPPLGATSEYVIVCRRSASDPTSSAEVSSR
jgi:SAM-dependent methyltransferase